VKGQEKELSSYNMLLELREKQLDLDKKKKRLRELQREARGLSQTIPNMLRNIQS
jgi:hypothetical protein